MQKRAGWGFKGSVAKQGGSVWYGLVPWFFLLAALPACYFVWTAERQVEYKEKEAAFESQLMDASSLLAKKITVYEHALYGARSLFDASELVTASEFERYSNGALHSRFYTDLKLIGFAKLVDLSNPDTYAKLAPELINKFKQLKQPILHAPIVYVASDQLDQSSMLTTTDAFNSAQLRNDMEAAAQDNVVLISEKVEREQDVKSHGLSMLLPVYNDPEISQQHTTINEAVHKTDGWLFLELDLDTIYASVFMQGDAPEIRYTLSKHTNLEAPQLLYQNVDDVGHASIFSDDKFIELYGQEWVLHGESLAAFEAKLDYADSNNVGLVGLLLTAGMTSILFLLVARLRAAGRLKAVNEQLKSGDERWQFAVEGSGHGVWDWDITKDQIEYSKRWQEIFGYNSQDLEGTAAEWQNFLHPEDRQQTVDTMNAYLSGAFEQYSIEYRLRCKDDSWKWVLSRGMVVAKDDQGKPTRMVGTHTDISPLKETQEQVWHHANVDHLTDLPNRRMFYDSFEREIEKSKWSGAKLALLFLDLDGFKEVNDTLGHDQGDLLLSQAGERLTEVTFTRDIVARFGGDEFIILIPELAAEKVKTVDLIAQKVLKVLSEPFLLNHEKVFLSASIGIAIYPDDSAKVDSLIKQVDQAMYASKDRGGNCFTYFTPEMQEHAIGRLQLSTDLRMALERQELFLEYQPIVELSTGLVYKAEALLRWQHPERGLVSPAEFIPVAEDTRLINEIGSWVFMESIGQCKIWRQAFDSRFQIAVNKSAVQFMAVDPKYHDWLEYLPERTEAPNAVIVEVTESILLEASEHVANRLEDYQAKGVQIALDDFGTGYSSLAYLREFDFDYLKIDQSFVAHLENSEADRVLCEAIIVMAHSLGMQVVAEGIENAEQLKFLTQAGCDYGQGWHFSKSLTPDKFEAYVKTVK